MPYSVVLSCARKFFSAGHNNTETEDQVEEEEEEIISTSHLQPPYDKLCSAPHDDSPSCTTLIEPDPSSKSLPRRISSCLQGLGKKLPHTRIDDMKDDTNTDTYSIKTVGSKYCPSTHGFQVYYSSGRGGAGNIRRALNSRAVCHNLGIPSGRKPSFAVSTTYSTGRGGTGNIRSPSSGSAADIIESCICISDAGLFRTAHVSRFLGRGGAGNVVLPT